MFIVLEGADGTGKSTLCSSLVKRLGAVHYATPPKKQMEIRTSIDRNATADEHYRFYRDGVYDASNEISDILNSGKDVVCDRYWLTTYTYHQIMGIEVSADDFKRVVMPDLTVLLTLNIEVQIARILKRGITVGDRRMLDKQKELSVAYYENILKFNIPFVAIDTQCFLPEICTDIVISAIKNRGLAIT